MDYLERKQIARYLLADETFIVPSYGPEDRLVKALVAQPLCSRLFDFDYPDGQKPTAMPITPKPNKSDPLPKADVVVITWTVAEARALADIFTCPYHRPSRSNPSKYDWYEYDRYFLSHYKPLIREGAPSRGDADDVNMLGSYFMSRIGEKKVLCFKSELHLNQDGIRTGDGTATLPVKDLFRQIIQETQATHILTTGTGGATYVEHDLGDVIITLSAKFRLNDEFKNEAFNNQTYKSDWQVPKQYLHSAEAFMQKHQLRIQEPDMLPPTEKYLYNGNPIPTQANVPNIYLEGLNLPAVAPILTTDFFEFGNSTTNNLQKTGCCVEMGDAVLGLTCHELGKSAPYWAVIRNLSDPVINGNLREDRSNTVTTRIRLQTMWAVWYYETYGYWTSINSALATWAIIAGL